MMKYDGPKADPENVQKTLRKSSAFARVPTTQQPKANPQRSLQSRYDSAVRNASDLTNLGNMVRGRQELKNFNNNPAVVAEANRAGLREQMMTAERPQRKIMGNMTNEDAASIFDDLFGGF